MSRVECMVVIHSAATGSQLWRRALLSLALSLCWVAVAAAAGGFTFSLPAGSINPSGLSLRLDDLGIDANGYRPIRIEIRPRGAAKVFPADRELRVELDFNRYGWQSSTVVSQIIELPEGASLASAVLLVPEGSAFSSLEIRTFEGGEKHPDLSQKYIGWPNVNGWSWTEARPAILFIDSHCPARADRETLVQNLNTAGVAPTGALTLPDVRQLLSHFPDISQRGGPPLPAAAVQNTQAATISDAGVLAVIKSRTRTEMLGPSELPTRWLELSQYDVAVMSLEDLKQLTQTDPQRFTALKEWLSTGPLLIVYGAGRQFERLQEVEAALKIPPLPAHDKQSNLRGWTAPQSGFDTGTLTTPFDDDDQGLTPPPATPGNAVAVEIPTEAKATEAAESNRSPPFLCRRAGLGCVAAMGAENPFPGRTRDWAYLFNAVPENHWKWFRRVGLSSQRTNDDYWKFLIPGVGEAPVIPFMVLVSLFAVVIGPINFLLLKRSRRLYLLLLTVPIGAVVVTGGLIVFALFSDGFGMRLRVRSFADLDQRTGHAAVWSRQSYYAAVAPSQGMLFPEDAMVLPLVYEPGAVSTERSTALHWDGEQHLRRGYLSARTATQFMVTRAATVKAKLVITESAAGGQQPRVENQLGTHVLLMVVCTSDGQMLKAENLADQAGKPLEATDWPEALSAFKPLTEAAEPIAPHDYDPRQNDDNLLTLLGGNRTRYYSNDGSAGDPLMSRSILETSLDASVSSRAAPPLPRSYLAIVARSPLVVSGVGGAREEASLHVIRGWY